MLLPTGWSCSELGGFSSPGQALPLLMTDYFQLAGSQLVPEAGRSPQDDAFISLTWT